MIVLSEENLLLDLAADSAESAIRALNDRLVAGGCTGADYADAVLAREREYPTGLPTEEVFTALPHAVCGGVARTGVAVARLRDPVDFQCMGSPDTTLPVPLIFLLANADGEGAHLTVLQELMGCFCRTGFLSDLMAARDGTAFLEILARAEEYPEA